MTALERIQAERRRQVEAEGWSPEHDDEHRNGELMQAGMCYFLHATRRAAYQPVFDHEDISRDRAANQPLIPMGWPWDKKWWKPKGSLRDLERAGALMLAEKDRLERAGISHAHVDHKLKLVIEAIDRPSPAPKDGGADGRD